MNRTHDFGVFSTALKVRAVCTALNKMFNKQTETFNGLDDLEGAKRKALVR